MRTNSNNTSKEQVGLHILNKAELKNIIGGNEGGGLIGK